MYLFVSKQASAQKTGAYLVEVSVLKQSLARAKEELGRVRKQLEEKQGMFNHWLALGTNE